MTEPDATPAQRTPLRVVPPGTEGRHSAAPEPGTSAASVPGGMAPAGAALVPLNAASRACAALGHHAAALWTDPGRLLHSLYHGRPGSMAGHIAKTKSLSWVPPEMTGKQRAFVTWSGIAWRMTIGLLLKNLGNGISAAADYPLAVIGLIAFAVLLIVLL